MNKPVIPAKVADAIEFYRHTIPPFSDARIVTIADNVGTASGPNAEAIRSIPSNTLMAALVNGYEREETPEDVFRRVYLDSYEEARRHTEEGWPQSAARCRGYASGMFRAAEILGIKIKGVNEY